mgnify:CR=1 FL=1
MPLLTAVGEFTKVKISSTANTHIHNRNLSCSIDADDHNIVIREHSSDVVAVNDGNVLALNGTTFAQCVTDVNNYFSAIPQP